jgi:hypothetical protein
MKRNQILLIIALLALVSLLLYYYAVIYPISEAQAVILHGTIEALRAGN